WAGASAGRPGCDKSVAQVGGVERGPSASRLRLERCPLGNAARATCMVGSGMLSPGDAGSDIGCLLSEDVTQRATVPPTRSILQETPVTGSALLLGGLPSRVCQRHLDKGRPHKCSARDRQRQKLSME